jgi:lipopolysaccharide assembly outer membrane protein LptD (OstA)
MNHLTLTRCLALGLVATSASVAHGDGQSAAATDWVIDTSGTYLCQGYYSPPLVEGSVGDDLNAEAENTDYDGSDRVILTGNAFITRNDFQLEADRVSFLNSTGDGDADGNVKIRRPNTLLIGDTASVNVRTNAFDLKNSSFVTHQNRLRGESDFAIGAPNGDIRVVNGTITFCAPGVNSWDLQADQIYLNQSSGRGWANDVIVRVKEIPVFYTPALGFPLDDRRLTGFLFPSYSLGSTSGTEIVTPFYWNLAPNYDLLIQPRFMTARGTAIGLHGRYLFEDFSLFEAKTEQLPDDKVTGTDRHISQLTLASDPSKAVIWNMTYEDASDGTYQDDLNNFADLSDKQQLTSSIGATVRGDTWSAGWIVDRIDVVDPSVTGSSFLDNPISGGDLVGDTREIALSLTSRGVNANGIETYRVTAGRTIFLQDRGVTLSGNAETTDQGPLVFESTARLAESLHWNTRFSSVADGETMDTATNEVKYKTSETDYVTQRIVWDNDAATRTDLYISNQIGQDWRFLAGTQWEPNTEQRVNQVVGIEYESCCWRAAVVHAYERDQVTSTNGGHSVKLQVELKGLGVLGRGASSIMERLLEGYELSEARY